MKFFRIAMSLLMAVAAVSFAVPQVASAAQGKSAGHRQDASHGHKGKKGGKSAGHRQDGSHRNSHAGTNGQ